MTGQTLLEAERQPLLRMAVPSPHLRGPRKRGPAVPDPGSSGGKAWEGPCAGRASAGSGEWGKGVCTAISRRRLQ